MAQIKCPEPKCTLRVTERFIKGLCPHDTFERHQASRSGTPTRTADSACAAGRPACTLVHGCFCLCALRRLHPRRPVAAHTFAAQLPFVIPLLALSPPALAVLPPEILRRRLCRQGLVPRAQLRPRSGHEGRPQQVRVLRLGACRRAAEGCRRRRRGSSRDEDAVPATVQLREYESSCVCSPARVGLWSVGWGMAAVVWQALTAAPRCALLRRRRDTPSARSACRSRTLPRAAQRRVIAPLFPHTYQSRDPPRVLKLLRPLLVVGWFLRRRSRRG